MKNPLAIVKEKFGDKQKLIAAVEAFTKKDDLWVNRINEKKGLAHVSNAKRTKDEGYKTRLMGYPVPRLYDLYQSTSKRHASAAKAPKAAKKAAAKPKTKAAPKAKAK